jgi:hypothetical protein
MATAKPNASTIGRRKNAVRPVAKYSGTTDSRIASDAPHSAPRNSPHTAGTSLDGPNDPGAACSPACARGAGCSPSLATRLAASPAASATTTASASSRPSVTSTLNV